MLRELIEQSLPGRTILEAADGTSALALAIQCSPRVVVMRHHLRDATRIDLIRQFSQLSDTTVILLTEIQGVLNTTKILWDGAFVCVHTSKTDTTLVALASHALNLPRRSKNEGALQ
jgi:DNA-binding NarL/FixJ family response regulator